MNRALSKSAPIYRIWVVAYDDWRPLSWHQRPPAGRMLELADDACFSRRQARAFLEGFNSEMLQAQQKRWAVAVPVR
jgi:hypothetical protein